MCSERRRGEGEGREGRGREKNDQAGKMETGIEGGRVCTHENDISVEKGRRGGGGGGGGGINKRARGRGRQTL